MASQHFWTWANADFARQRARFLETRAQGSKVATTVGDDVMQTQDVAPDESEFYAAYLDSVKDDFAKYNRMLWRTQIELLWPAVQAACRPILWRVAVLRHQWRARLFSRRGPKGTL